MTLKQWADNGWLKRHHSSPEEIGNLTLTHQGHDPQIYFWRTASGSEVDLVVEAGDRLVPIEVKLSATPRPAFAKAIKAFRKDLGTKVMPGYVIHPGEIRLPLGSDVTALPLREL